MVLHKKAAIAAIQKNITLNEFIKIAVTFTLNHEKEMQNELMELDC